MDDALGWAVAVDRARQAPAGSTGADMTFTRHNVGQVCTLVRGSAMAAGIDPWAVDDLLIAVSEIVTNAICYAGGTGSITLRNRSDGLLVEISDHGPGLPDTSDAAPSTEDGRGLWLARVLVHEFDLVSTPAGVTVRLSMLRNGSRVRRRTLTPIRVGSGAR